MKFFENNKFIFKLIASLCIFLVIINFGMSPKARAEDDPVSAVGGTLLDPIASLLAGLGDGVMQIIQKLIMGTDATVTYDNSDEKWYEIVGRVLRIFSNYSSCNCNCCRCSYDCCPNCWRKCSRSINCYWYCCTRSNYSTCWRINYVWFNSYNCNSSRSSIS